MGFFQERRASMTAGMEIGETRTGTIIGAEEEQVRNYDDGKPAFWDDGRERKQLVIQLECEPDPDDPLDNGMRYLFVERTSAKKTGSLYQAIIAALKEAEAPALDIQPGAKLAVKKSGTAPSQNPKFKDRIMWKAWYKLPDPKDTRFFSGDDPEDDNVDEHDEPPRRSHHDRDWKPSARHPDNGREEVQRAARKVATSDESDDDSDDMPWENERRPQRKQPAMSGSQRRSKRQQEQYDDEPPW